MDNIAGGRDGRKRKRKRGCRKTRTVAVEIQDGIYRNIIDTEDTYDHGYKGGE